MVFTSLDHKERAILTPRQSLGEIFNGSHLRSIDLHQLISRPGDELVEVNRSQVRTIEDLTQALSRSEDGALFVVKRGENQILVDLPLDS